MSRFIKATAFIAAMAAVMASVYGVAYFLQVNLDLMWLSILAMPLPLVAGCCLIIAPVLSTLYLAWREYCEYRLADWELYTRNEMAQAVLFALYTLMAGGSMVGGLAIIVTFVASVLLLPILPIVGVSMSIVALCAVGAGFLGFALTKHRNQQVAKRTADTQLHQNGMSTSFLDKVKSLNLDEYFQLMQNASPSTAPRSNSGISDSGNEFDFVKASKQLQNQLLFALFQQRPRLQSQQEQNWCARLNAAATLESLDAVWEGICNEIETDRDLRNLYSPAELLDLLSNESKITQHYQNLCHEFTKDQKAIKSQQSLKLIK